MDDFQLFQIFWSFVVVYILCILAFSMIILIISVKESSKNLRNAVRITIFTLIFQVLEAMMKRYDFLFFLSRLFLLLLLQRWYKLYIRLKLILTRY